MNLYRLDIWIQIKDREGLAKALSLPETFSGGDLAGKISLSFDRVYGEREDMMHFFHGSDIPQSEDVIDYDEEKIREIAPFLSSGGISVFPFTGQEAYARYLIRDGKIKKMEASILWHIPDTEYIRRGDPAFTLSRFEDQIEAAKKRQKQLYPPPKKLNR